MARYVDVDKLAKDPYMQDFYQQLAIREAPTADVKEVVKGEWKRSTEYLGEPMVCSNCNALFLDTNFNFCPNCGADMRGIANKLTQK